MLCNDLNKQQQVLSDLYFTLVLAASADSFLLRGNLLQASSWDPCQFWASFFCKAKLMLARAVVPRGLACACQQ